MWKVVKLIFPARMVEKIDMISTASRRELERRTLPYVSLEDLPAFYGGHASDDGLVVSPPTRRPRGKAAGGGDG